MFLLSLPIHVNIWPTLSWYPYTEHHKPLYLQVYRSPSGTPHPRRWTPLWLAFQRKTTPGCTRWTPSWWLSSSWARWASCWEPCAPDCSSTALAPTAACPRAPPPRWKTTTSNSTTDSSTRSNSTNNAAAPRREDGGLQNWTPNEAREADILWKALSLFSPFAYVHFSQTSSVYPRMNKPLFGSKQTSLPVWKWWHRRVLAGQVSKINNMDPILFWGV